MIVSLVTLPGQGALGIVSVHVPPEMATAGAGFSFQLPPELANQVLAPDRVTATTVNGGALPSWLRYVPGSFRFVAAAVPDGAFPLTVLVTINGQRTEIVITER